MPFKGPLVLEERPKERDLVQTGDPVLVCLIVDLVDPGDEQTN